MPSEAKQSELPQPWKVWHGSLDPWSRQDIKDGAVYVNDGEDKNHGTVAIDKKDVDLSAPKATPKL